MLVEFVVSIDTCNSMVHPAILILNLLMLITYQEIVTVPVYKSSAFLALFKANSSALPEYDLATLTTIL